MAGVPKNREKRFTLGVCASRGLYIQAGLFNFDGRAANFYDPLSLVVFDASLECNDRCLSSRIELGYFQKISRCFERRRIEA